jgi:predicted  nucleic acid-binding Zn-ribbon protein
MSGRRKTVLDELKKLRAEVKSQRDTIKHHLEGIEKVRAHRSDLKAKLEAALERLQMISVNTVFSNETISNDSEHRMKVTATQGLKKIALMQERYYW